jgi:hypothetical protein
MTGKVGEQAVKAARFVAKSRWWKKKDTMP